MLKKSVTYEDLDGNTNTEDFYFHLTKADLVEMEMSYPGGLHAHLQKIVDDEDGRAIMHEFKELILSSYGKRSPDGKRFIKTPELRQEFHSSEAYSALFMELCLNADVAADFVNGIVPPNLEQDVAKLEKANGESDVRVVTVDELKAMEAELVEDIQKGLMTGHVRIAP